MHRAQLIFLSRQGPAMELLGLAQGCGWATGGWRSAQCFCNLTVPPKTSARPPPTCLASSRAWPNYSPTRGCRGVGLPVGTHRLPRLGSKDLLPRSSTKVMKHEKRPGSSPDAGLQKGKKSQQGPQFLAYSENILFQALIKHSLNSRDAKKTAISTNLAHIAGPLS